MLDTVSELTKDYIRDVERILADKIYADTLRTDQSDNLFDLLHQRVRRVIKEQVSLVEEEDHLRLLEISHFRQVLVELGQHPEKECPI